MEISELPGNWREFAKPIDLESVAKSFSKEEGAYDARCPSKEDGPILIVAKGEAFLLPEANLVAAIQSQHN